MSSGIGCQIMVEIPEAFYSFVPAAVVRLSYLFPSYEFSLDDGAVKVTSDSDENLALVRREVMHQIYRERIYSETLTVRKWLSGD